MRFADTDGTSIDIYQGVSQLVNENGINYDSDVNVLLTNATGSKGYYGFFGTHDDYRDSTFSDSIVNASQNLMYRSFQPYKPSLGLMGETVHHLTTSPGSEQR